MTKLKEEMMRVHEDTDFKVNFAGVTKPNEFEYSHGGRVSKGLNYHIHYTNSKEEVFMTDAAHTSSSKIIKKLYGDVSLFSQYTTLKSSIRDEYPQKTLPNPTEADYRIGKITRYFTQKANNLFDEIFEISKEDYDNQNNLFRYVEFSWRISGTKFEVLRENINTLNIIQKTRGNFNITRQIWPLQYWKPNPNSPDDIQRKLGRLINRKSNIIPTGPPAYVDWSLVNPNRYELDDDLESPGSMGTVINPATGESVNIRDLTNIVYDEDGNMVMGFADGTRVDLTETGP